jgi:hypothetical protein
MQTMMSIAIRPLGRARPPTTTARLTDGWDRPGLRDLSRSLELPTRLETGRALADRAIREALDQVPLGRDRRTQRRRRMTRAIVIASAAGLGLVAWWAGRRRAARLLIDAYWRDDAAQGSVSDRPAPGIPEPMTEMGGWPVDGIVDETPVREPVGIGIVTGA